MLPVQMTPTSSKNDLPSSAKLRIEADPGVISGGDGSLYVGFPLDPLYEVHWNNLAPQPEFAFTVVPDRVEQTLNALLVESAISALLTEISSSEVSAC